MKSLRSAAILATLLLSFTTSAPAQPQSDTAATAQALNALLAASNGFIPESSSCSDDYGQRGKATVKDMLAAHLATMSSGDNRIQGKCALDRCELKITHAEGTAATTATIKFDLLQGQAKLSTLECTATP
jgi:hypothetical protein